MKIWSITNNKDFNQNDNLLLKVDFNGEYGFCSYSPWLSLGQKSIDESLKEVLALNSSLISLAWKDAFIYQQIACSELSLFKSHSFYSENLSCFSPEIVKVKLSGNIENDLKKIEDIETRFETLRLDANYKFELEDFLVFWEDLGRFKDKIEYIEDPIPWNDRDYRRLLDLEIPIALDQMFNNSLQVIKNYKKLILKPTVQVVHNNVYKNCIFSHNMNGAFSDWQVYCELLRSGDLKEIHGVASNSKFKGEELFKVESEYVLVNPDVVRKMYDYLNIEASWERIF